MRETDRDRERKGEREREKERERERRRERETPCQTGRDSLRTGIGVANGLVTPMRVRRLSMPAGVLAEAAATATRSLPPLRCSRGRRLRC